MQQVLHAIANAPKGLLFLVAFAGSVAFGLWRLFLALQAVGLGA